MRELLNMNQLLPPESTLPDVLASVALLASLIAAWAITGRALRARDSLSEQVTRRWTANVRNALLLVAVVGLLMIWAPQLRTFALSLTAVAVAIVVATKELLLCLSGSAFRTATRAYSIGDIIEIGANRGEVVDIDLLSTRLREMDRRDGSIRLLGQSAVVPHSLLFSQPARVIARQGMSTLHGFSMVFETGADLFSKLDEVCERAASALREAREAQVEGDEEEVSVSISTTDLGRLRLELEFATPPREALRLETAIAVAVGSLVCRIGESTQASPR